jgi:hypothetical protein
MSPNPTDPNSVASRFIQTQLPAVQRVALAHIMDAVDNLNANLKTAYLQAFADWLINWNAGRVRDKSTAPPPPNAYVVGYFNDPTTGPGSLGPYANTVVQWAYPQVGTDPVCQQPPIPDQVQPQVHPVVTGNDQVQNVPDGDTMPVGFKVTAPDGSVWQKVASPTPFGTATYYARVS